MRSGLDLKVTLYQHFTGISIDNGAAPSYYSFVRLLHNAMKAG
jgi:hypothetical protein